MDILGFGITQIATFLLVLVRVAGIFTSAPIFGNTHVTPPVKITLALALAFIFLPMAKYDGPLELLPYALALLKEAFVGIIMGFLVAMVFAAIQMAGAFVDLQVGFGFAEVVDPMVRERNAVLGQLHNLAATLLFLAINGHHLVIQGLSDSFSVLPLGAMTLAPEVAGGMMSIFVTIFVSALKIAAPMFGAVFLTDITLGILARTVPQLNVFVVGFPVKLGIGMMATIIVLPTAFVVMTKLFTGIHRDILMLLKHLGG